MTSISSSSPYGSSVSVGSRDVAIARADVKSSLILIGVLALSILAYYFVGVDQGAVSIFGSDTHIHEYVHDARHFAGFPCH